MGIIHPNLYHRVPEEMAASENQEGFQAAANRSIDASKSCNSEAPLMQ